MSGYLIALVVIAPIWLLCSLYNRNALANVHGSIMTRRYDRKYGREARKQYLSERRWFIGCGPLGAIPLFLSRHGIEVDFMLPLALQRFPELYPNAPDY